MCGIPGLDWLHAGIVFKIASGDACGESNSGGCAGATAHCRMLPHVQCGCAAERCRSVCNIDIAVLRGHTRARLQSEELLQSDELATAPAGVRRFAISTVQLSVELTYSLASRAMTWHNLIVERIFSQLRADLFATGIRTFFALGVASASCGGSAWWPSFTKI